MDKLLKLLERDCSLSPKQLSSMLGISEDEVKAQIRKYEKNKTILGYNALIDWDKTDNEDVNALIALNIIPSKGDGFDKTAERISHFPQVKSVYLMSGNFDIAVMIEGKDFKEVALFVSQKLAPMEGVTSTSTLFVLKKYKDKGVKFDIEENDSRGCVIYD